MALAGTLTAAAPAAAQSAPASSGSADGAKAGTSKATSGAAARKDGAAKTARHRPNAKARTTAHAAVKNSHKTATSKRGAGKSAAKRASDTASKKASKPAAKAGARIAGKSKLAGTRAKAIARQARTRHATRTAAVPTPRTRPGASAALSLAPARAALASPREASLAVPAPRAPLADVPAVPIVSNEDIAAVRRAIEVMRGGDPAGALQLAAGMTDPVARMLIEWVVLRYDNNLVGFARYANFIAANPSWPNLSMFRRRAESMLWLERPDAATVRSFFASEPPMTAKGKMALARVLLAQGDRGGAQALVRSAWRSDPMPPELEAQTRDEFGAFISAGDDKARMESRLHANDSAGGMRAARRLGGAQIAIAKLRIALSTKSGNVKALLDAVPHDARNDVGFVFAHLQVLRRADKFGEAGKLMLTVPRDPAQLHDTDDWWIERRLLARKLLDVGDPKTAYLVARDAGLPTREVYQVEHEFTAGWIALRFLHDPQAASAHFSRIPDFTNNPISLGRAGYWLGRAAEAAHRPQEARKHYESAARWTTSYYGQIARARLGMSEMVVYAPPASAAQRASVERLELARAAEILYALDERKLALPLMADLGNKLDDVGALAALGEVTARHRDARAMMQLGKAAVARGHALGQYAFPTIGIPDYAPIAPTVDPSIVYSIVRTESAFDPGDISSAQAMGLMQVTPEAAKDTCKRFRCTYDRKRLRHDSVYNVQVGAAELAALFEDYRGSYIMAFAGYNAGRGRIREWVARYGDPRDPNVDPIDWVEKIPFSETRNYVQRVLENLQVYRVRFGGGAGLLIEADLHRGALKR